jgi:hypothetical protein
MPRLRRVARWLRGPLSLACVCLLSVNGVLAAQVTPSVGGFESEFLKWVLTQGGLTICLLGTLWSYRRDLARLLHEEESRNQVLMALVEKVTAALTHVVDEINNCPFHASKT